MRSHKPRIRLETKDAGYRQKIVLAAETRLLGERVSHSLSRGEIKILPILAKYENELHEFMNSTWG